MDNAEWYVDWFNSPYYHLLYNNRNHSEANHFIDQLCSHLQLKPDARIWDLACGKGRHAIALSKKGYDVTGTDLSENSIREATLHANAHLHFFVHDMRSPFKTGYFDAVFNLFTSFGYFKDFDENFLVFKNLAASLKPKGLVVVDFFNSEKVIASFKPNYTEQRGDITFDINKTVVNNSIVKRIEFSDKEKKYYFEESVSLLKKEDFENFAREAKLGLCKVFGNYHLEEFNKKKSDRLILIYQK